MGKVLSAFERPDQMSPSENCCTAKNIGIRAKARWGVVLDFLSAEKPTEPINAAEPKLTVAEKHIIDLVF